MSMNCVIATLATWVILAFSQGPSYRPKGPWGPAPGTLWYPPPPWYGPYGGYCCFTININFPPNNVSGNNPVPTGPLALLPNGSMILPGGSIRFPNATVVLTQYASGVVPPAGKMPSGRIIFANNTILGPGVNASLPPPGFPLIAPLETTAYPPLILPNRTVIFHNGTLAAGNGRISTVFTKGYNPNCGGLMCHFFVPTGKK